MFSSISPPKKTVVCLLYCFMLSPVISLGAVPHYNVALSVKVLTYRARTWAPGGRLALGMGTGILGSRCSEHGLEGARLQVATPPGPLWLHLGRMHPQDDRAGPQNQRFSNCTVSRTHLGSRDSESVGLG